MFLGKPNAALANGDTVCITVRAEGGMITVSADGSKVLSVFDAEAYLSGYVGLHAESGTLMIFSDYVYHAL